MSTEQIVFVTLACIALSAVFGGPLAVALGFCFRRKSKRNREVMQC